MEIFRKSHAAITDVLVSKNRTIIFRKENRTILLMRRLDIENISIDDILATCGYRPSYEKGDSTWYISPFREESEPSFQVRGSVFTDWGNPTYKGGVLDLCSFLFDIPRCNSRELFQKLEEISCGSSNLTLSSTPKNVEITQREKVVATYPLNNPLLADYLISRGVELSVAQQFTKVVVYMDSTRKKKLFGIGFANRSGGYELRNKFSKRSFAPKDISILPLTSNTENSSAVVFEGFMDALSYISDRMRKGLSLDFTPIVLNGVGMVEKAKDELRNFKHIYGLLDNDEAGNRATEYLKSEVPNFVDRRNWIGDFKDVNEKIVCELKLSQKQRPPDIETKRKSLKI